MAWEPEVMIALDTNLCVRYLTNDDPAQAKQVLRILEQAEEVFLPKTVLLELEWVLRAVYELPRESVRRALLQILGLSNVSVESSQQVEMALKHYELGLDFADALHLAACGGMSFLSFDTAMLRKARRLGLDAAPP
jgi:predicted nucleic-acid-binding protein